MNYLVYKNELSTSYIHIGALFYILALIAQVLGNKCVFLWTQSISRLDNLESYVHAAKIH